MSIVRDDSKGQPGASPRKSMGRDAPVPQRNLLVGARGGPWYRRGDKELSPMFKLPLYQSKDGRTRPTQPYSPRTLDKHARVRGATVVDSICPYCAVGCATQVYTKGGQ